MVLVRETGNCNGVLNFQGVVFIRVRREEKGGRIYGLWVRREEIGFVGQEGKGIE